MVMLLIVEGAQCLLLLGVAWGVYSLRRAVECLQAVDAFGRPLLRRVGQW